MSTRVRTEFPRRVHVIRHTWIPMSDRSRLAARIWLPEDAEEDPVPAVMEYIPYRKNDALALRDAPIHAYFAGNGYASVRVDLRGSGDSDGIMLDEYLPQEQSDGLDALRWLAVQPWCTGKVGIIGKSWGGFNGLQIASHAPPELGAVISVASTDDRYADDVHYMGGCMLSATQLSWASTMFAYNARPPDPHVVGDKWREQWLERMRATPPFVEQWVRHQRRDDFWKQGSVCEDFSAIKCPVYMVGGWADAYRNAVLRFLADYPGPCKGIIGPWAHVYPEVGVPGPAIGFLQEAVRWWDRWLKDTENGIMDEPKLRVYVPDAVRSAPRETWPGRWVALDSWPAAAVENEVHALSGPGVLGGEPGLESEVQVSSPEALLSDPGIWGGLGGPIDQAGDQRAADGQSLCFDTQPLVEGVEVLGFPVARLEIAVDRPLALLAARLCDVWPDGASRLITRGFLNLTHRSGHERLEVLVPGERYTVEVKLNSIACSVPAGHRLRLSVSTSYWPWIWPSPERVRLSVYVGARSQLELPALTRGFPSHEPPPHFFDPEEAPTPAHAVLRTEDARREIRLDVGSGRLENDERSDEGKIRLLDDGLEHGYWQVDFFRIFDGDPLSALNRCERDVVVGRGDWQTRVHTLSTMTSTADAFHLSNVLEAYEGEARVYVSASTVSVPRDHV
jgi:putative CocE/NonD family hydrolase